MGRAIRTPACAKRVWEAFRSRESECVWVVHVERCPVERAGDVNGNTSSVSSGTASSITPATHHDDHECCMMALEDCRTFRQDMHQPEILEDCFAASPIYPSISSRAYPPQASQCGSRGRTSTWIRIRLWLEDMECYLHEFFFFLAARWLFCFTGGAIFGKLLQDGCHFNDKRQRTAGKKGGVGTEWRSRMNEEVH